jgi:hypothetical protein
MIVRASGLGMGVGRFSRLQRGLGVPPMQGAGLDTTRRVESVCEVPLGAGEPGAAVVVLIDCRWFSGWGGSHASRDIGHGRIVPQR